MYAFIVALWIALGIGLAKAQVNFTDVEIFVPLNDLNHVQSVQSI